jgi:nucleotide-binding universal stress UspA family protein
VSGIVVGVDESDGAARALAWAAREGRLHRWRVTALLAWGYVDKHHEDDDTFDPHYGQRNAVATLDAFVEKALGPSAAAAIDRLAVCDLAAGALLDASSGADLLVVGARGLGGFRGLLLGSVSQHCLHHTTCPIAIVRHDGDSSAGETTGRIVVGVDGSQVSQRALQWAVDEARRWQASLEVVHVWHMPYVGEFPYVGARFNPATLEETAQRVLDEMVVRVDTTGLPRPVDRILVCGGAASVLLESAKGADLVVVGSRGLGGFAGLLLGSVSHHVAHHATCPVVIVPPVDA